MINFALIREVGLYHFVKRRIIRQFYKRILRRSHRMLLPTGEWLMLPRNSLFASEAFVTGANVDWGSEALFHSMVEGCGAFLDVGANIGYYTLYLLPKVLHVYSFEPDPRAREALLANVADRQNITIVPTALANEQGSRTFILDAGTETSRLQGADEEPTELNLRIDVTSIDAFAQEHEVRLECIKIDAEGADIEVLQGSLRVLLEQQPLVLSEVEPTVALFSLMSAVNYRVFAFVRDHRTRIRVFEELDIKTTAGGDTKMLFLVPYRLLDRFKDFQASFIPCV